MALETSPVDIIPEGADMEVRFTFKGLCVSVPIDDAPSFDLGAFEDSCWGLVGVIYRRR